jgi:type I restriction enzyme S subunit
MQIDSASPLSKGNFRNYPSDWTVIELGNLLKKVRKPVDVIPDNEYQEIGIRSHGKGLFYKEPIKGSDLGNKSVFWIEEDCLILNIVFAWEQAVALTTSQEKGMIASHRFPMWKPKENVDLNYLYKLFLTPLGRHLLELASPGGAGRNKTLGQEDFNNILVCIPGKIEEQQKIVSIFAAWDKAIELKSQLIAEKKQQKEWLMQNLLTGKKRLPGFDGDWQKVLLGEVASVCTGDKNSQDKVNNGKYPFYVRSDSIEKINSYSFDGEAILIPGDGKIGEIYHYIVGKFDFHQRVYKISDFHSCIGKYIYYYLSAFFFKEAMKYSAKATVDSLRMSILTGMEVLLPSLTEQTAIAEILSTADREIELHERQLAELKKQKKALMQILLTGIVRVNTQGVS